MPAIPGGDVYLEPAKTQPADDRVTDEALARLLARPSE